MAEACAPGRSLGKVVKQLRRLAAGVGFVQSQGETADWGVVPWGGETPSLRFAGGPGGYSPRGGQRMAQLLPVACLGLDSGSSSSRSDRLSFLLDVFLQSSFFFDLLCVVEGGCYPRVVVVVVSSSF